MSTATAIDAVAENIFSLVNAGVMVVNEARNIYNIYTSSAEIKLDPLPLGDVMITTTTTTPALPVNPTYLPNISGGYTWPVPVFPTPEPAMEAEAMRDTQKPKEEPKPEIKIEIELFPFDAKRKIRVK
jgi:hypothetical protein